MSTRLRSSVSNSLPNYDARSKNGDGHRRKESVNNNKVFANFANLYLNRGFLI